MSLADEVHALELERDTLTTEVAAMRAALATQRERGSLAAKYWRSRAEEAESHRAVLEAHAQLSEFAQRPIADPGKWHVSFAYDGTDPAGLDFEGNSLAQMLSGLIIGWFEKPKPLDISITEPKVREAA